jgi:transcriptional regulator with XRE-family HTH domain
MGFGNRIRQIRLQRGITQETIAKKLGLTSQSYVSDVEHNKFIPQGRKMETWAKTLGLTMEEVEDLILESKIEKLGISDPSFTMMFKDIPKMTKEEKESLIRAYEAILKARGKKR